MPTTSNPFCELVGPPPVSMLPEPDAPHAWIDDYLSVFDLVCT